MGKRMDSPTEKPLNAVAGKLMVERVIDALVQSGRFHGVVAAVSPNAPRTREFLLSLETAIDIGIIETAGSGFGLDLSHVLTQMKPEKVFVVPADMPLLDRFVVGSVSDRLLENQGAPAVSVVVTRVFAEAVGASACVAVDLEGTPCCHSGITLFDTAQIEGRGFVPEKYVPIDRIELAVNVNTKIELQMAERLLT